MVDCSDPKTYKEWWQILDANDRDPVRDIAENYENIDVNPTSSAKVESDESEDERRLKIQGSANVAPYRGIKVGSGFQLERKTQKSNKTTTEYRPTETITFLEDTSKDPNSITRTDGTHYTKFEVNLCKHVLREIKTKLKEIVEEMKTSKEIDEHSREQKVISMKELADGFQGKDPIAELKEFVKDAMQDAEEGSIEWKMVADACTSYIDRKHFRCTHYVHCITLGRIVQQSETSERTTTTASGKGQATGLDYVDIGTGLESSKVLTTKSTARLTRGTEDKQEIIRIETRAVSDLISEESQNLRLIITELVERRLTIDEGKRCTAIAIQFLGSNYMYRQTILYMAANVTNFILLQGRNQDPLPSTAKQVTD